MRPVWTHKPLVSRFVECSWSSKNLNPAQSPVDGPFWPEYTHIKITDFSLCPSTPPCTNSHPCITLFSITTSFSMHRPYPFVKHGSPPTVAVGVRIPTWGNGWNKSERHRGDRQNMQQLCTSRQHCQVVSSTGLKEICDYPRRWSQLLFLYWLPDFAFKQNVF